MRQALLLILGFAFVAGCGGGSDEWTEKRPATAPAEGKLTYKGEGVEGATVLLVPDAAGGEVYGASAVTRSGGAFALAAWPPQTGVVPGKYKVAVSKKVMPEMSEVPADSHDSDNTAPPAKNMLPEQYGDPNKSGLTLEVPATGKTDILLELK
ncbi:MAG: hypothetical protein M3552_06080 [Planctomycetota bacterium]|nr:carboxypeptidase regulatory-like domain-containing protein [Planctomycetaceae bacterium]MDQ3330205.1 hypothetical protein [Planctomycetota bacterium]